MSLCDSGLFGLIIMLLSSALSGLLFTILVWCNSHTWIYFKHKGRYIKVRLRYISFFLTTTHGSLTLGHVGLNHSFYSV